MNENTKDDSISENLTPDRKMNKLQELTYIMFYYIIKGKFFKITGKQVLELIFFIQIISLILYEYSLNNELNYMVTIIVEIFLIFPYCPVIILFIIICLHLLCYIIILTILFICYKEVLSSKILKYMGRKIGFVVLLLSTIFYIPIVGISLLLFTCNNDKSSYCENQAVFLIMIIISLIQLVIYCIFISIYDLLSFFHISKENLFGSERMAFFNICKRAICIIGVISLILKHDIISIVSLILFALESIFELVHNYNELKPFFKTLISAKFVILTISLIEIAIYLFNLKNYSSLFIIVILSIILPFVYTYRIQLSKDFIKDAKTVKQMNSVGKLLTYLLKTFTTLNSSKAILKLIFLERGEEEMKSSKSDDNNFLRNMILQETKILFLEFLGKISQLHNTEFTIDFCGFSLLYLKDPSIAYLNLLKINSKHLGLLLNYKLFSILKIIEKQKIEQKKTKATIKLSKLMKFEVHYNKFIENIKDASNKSSELWEKLSEISPDLCFIEKNGEKVYRLYKEIHQSFKKIINIFPNNAKIYEIYASFTLNIINNETKSNKYLKKVELNNNNNYELIDSLKEDLLGKIVTDAETPVLGISANKSNIGYICYMNLKCSKSLGFVPNELNGLSMKKIISSIYFKDLKSLEQALVELKDKNKDSINFFEKGLFFKTKSGYLLQYKLNILDFPSIQNNYTVLFGLNYIGKEEDTPPIIILSNSRKAKNINEKCMRLGILNSNLQNNSVLHNIISQISLDKSKVQISLPSQNMRYTLANILENFQEDDANKNAILFNVDIVPIQSYSDKVIGFSLFLTQELKKDDKPKANNISRDISNQKFEHSECIYFEDFNKFMFISEDVNSVNSSGVSNLNFFNSHIGKAEMNNFVQKVLVPRQNFKASLENKQMDDERKSRSSSVSQKSNANLGKSHITNLFQQFSNFQPKEGKDAFNELIKKMLAKQSSQYAENIRTYRFVSDKRFDLVEDIEKNIENLIEPETDDDSESVTRKKNSTATINLIQSKLKSNKKLYAYLKKNTRNRMKLIFELILFFLLAGYMAALIVDCIEVTNSFNTSLFGLQVQYTDIIRSRSLFNEMHYLRELNLSRVYNRTSPIYSGMTLAQYDELISKKLDEIIDIHIKSTIDFEIKLSSLSISPEMFEFLDEHTMEITDFIDENHNTITREVNSYTTYLTLNSAFYNYNMEKDNLYIDFNFLFHNLFNPIYSDIVPEVIRLYTTLREQNNISINQFLAFNYAYISVSIVILILGIINSVIINKQTKFILKLLLDVPAKAWLTLSDKAMNFTIKIKKDEDSNKHFDDSEIITMPRAEESRSEFSSMQKRMFTNWPLTLCKSITVISILVAFLFAYSISACIIKRNKMLAINEWTISIAELNYPIFISIPTFEFLREAFIKPKAQIMYKNAEDVAYESVMNLSERYKYFLSNQQDLKTVSDKNFENHIDDYITGDLCRFVEKDKDLYSFCLGYENGILREGIHASYSLFIIQMKELLGHLIENSGDETKNYTYAFSNYSYNLYTATNEIMIEGFSHIYEAIYEAVQNSIEQSILSYNIYTICMIFFIVIIGTGLLIAELYIIISKEQLSLKLLTLIPLDHIWKVRRISQFIFKIQKKTNDEKE